MPRLYPVVVKRTTGSAGTVLWTPPFRPARSRVAALAALDVAGSTQRQRDLALTHIDTVMEAERARGVDLSVLAVSAGVDRRRGLTTLRLAPGPLVAEKDVWVDTSAASLDNANHNADLLRVNGLPANDSVSYIAWNFERWDGQCVVLAANLAIQWFVEPVLAGSVDIHELTTDADEQTWSETTLIRTNRPAFVAAPDQTFTWTVPNTQTVALNSTILNRLSERTGVGFVTLVVAAGTGNLETRPFANYETNFGVNGPFLTGLVMEITL